MLTAATPAVASTGRVPRRLPGARATCPVASPPPSASPPDCEAPATSGEGGRASQFQRKGLPPADAHGAPGPRRAPGSPSGQGGLVKLVLSFSRHHGADLHPEKQARGVEWVTGSRRPPASQAPGPGGQTLLPPSPSPHTPTPSRPACRPALPQALSVPWQPGVLPLPTPSTSPAPCPPLSS